MLQAVHAATPDVAVFGEKDYQQLCVIRQMVRDLDLPLEIAGVPTVREADGLALSSRNAYLTAEERKVAPALNRVLRDVADKASAVMRGAGPAKNKAPRPTPLVRDPTLPPQAHQLPDLTAICEAAASALQSAGFGKIDYVAVRHADTLKVVTETGDAPLRVLAAAWLGNTRLIDNVGDALGRRPARRQQDTRGDEADAEQVVDVRPLAEQDDGEDGAENRHEVHRKPRGIGAEQFDRAVEGEISHDRSEHGNVPNRQQRVPAQRHRTHRAPSRPSKTAAGAPRR